MPSPRALTLAGAVLVAAACGAENPTRPALDLPVAEAKPQEVACRASTLKAVEKGKIMKNDCLFGVDQREDLFRVDQAALGLPDLSGSHMLTFTTEADFEGLFGVSTWDESTFGAQVYGSRGFSPATQGTFSLLGSAPEYKLFVSGNDGSQLGRYEVTTTVETSTNSCQAGRLVFLQGDVALSAAISDGNACDGTILVGEYAGNPLKYHYWYAKLAQGQTATVSVEGVDPGAEPVTLAVIRWGAPGQPPLFSQLDFAAGPGDTDRSITFTAPAEGYYYVEVSTIPGFPSPYDFAFTTH